jgi:hypothetical protein
MSGQIRRSADYADYAERMSFLLNNGDNTCGSGGIAVSCLGIVSNIFEI